VVVGGEGRFWSTSLIAGFNLSSANLSGHHLAQLLLAHHSKQQQQQQPQQQQEQPQGGSPGPPPCGWAPARRELRAYPGWGSAPR